MSEIQKPLAKRAVDDAVNDRASADRFLEASDTQALHTLCHRMIDDREKMAKGFNAVIMGWSLIDDRGAAPDNDAIAAIERVAHEAIQFAREVVQAIKPKGGKS